MIKNESRAEEPIRDLDAAYLSLVRDWSLWEVSIETAMQRITRAVCEALRGVHVSLWIMDQDCQKLTLSIMYSAAEQRYSQGAQLEMANYPSYFAALDEDRIIAANDARTDYRTREFTEDYLIPLGVGAMLDATLRIAGKTSGVLCTDVGSARIWNENEKRFAISVADLVAQLFTHHEMRQSEARLRELAAAQQAILDGAEYSIISTDTRGTILSFNRAAQRMLGYGPEEVIGKQASEIFHDPDEIALCARELSVDQGATVQPGFDVFVVLSQRDRANEREWSYIDKTGRRFPVRLSVTPMYSPDGKISGYMGIAADLSERKQVAADLRDSEARYRTLFDGASDGIFLMREGRYVDCNPAAQQIFSCSREDIIGATPYQYSPQFQPDDRLSIDKAREKINAALDGVPQCFEWRHMRRDGTPFDAEVTLSAVEIGGIPHVLATLHDISERKQSAAKIEYLAYYDQLTGLPNRSLFLDRLEQALKASLRTKRFGAVMYIDLDQFKHINDVHGHGVGDTVLREVSHRLRGFLRRVDTVTRIGGDEFAILLPEIASTQEVAASHALVVGEKVRVALEAPVQAEGLSHVVTASIGVSLFPKAGENVDDMLREADIAMYRAKKNGRNTLVFFEDDMQAVIEERYALEQDLREALRSKHFALYLQSQVDASGKIIGAEALIRWHHPVRGMVSPASFIPIAEETGQIAQIGEWVLREACHLIAKLGAVGVSLRIAVNVSPRQFHQTHFVTLVRDILAETGADPNCLTLEITESLLVDRADDVITRMQLLADLGVRFAIDDFGTGYSSLSYLKRLPLHELKIDKSFVQDVPQDTNDVTLVETILSMAQHMGLEVVAEGVETRAQFDFLVAQRCEYFQGYLFHRPTPLEQWLLSFDQAPV